MSVRVRVCTHVLLGAYSPKPTYLCTGFLLMHYTYKMIDTVASASPPVSTHGQAYLSHKR